MEEFACYNVEKWWHELNIFLNLTTFSLFPAFWNVLVQSHFCRHLNDTVLWIDRLLNSVVLLCLQVTGCLPWQRGTLLVATWNTDTFGDGGSGSGEGRARSSLGRAVTGMWRCSHHICGGEAAHQHVFSRGLKENGQQAAARNQKQSRLQGSLYDKIPETLNKMSCLAKRHRQRWVLFDRIVTKFIFTALRDKPWITNVVFKIGFVELYYIKQIF